MGTCGCHHVPLRFGSGTIWNAAVFHRPASNSCPPGCLKEFKKIMSTSFTMSSEAMDTVNKLAGHPILLYLHASGATLLVVDWLSTLDVEITYAWKGPWNMGRVLYFITRYFVLLGTLVWLYCNFTFSVAPSLCSRIYAACSGLLVFGFIVAEMIMTIRVFALWGRRRAVGILLITMSVIDITASIVTFTLFRVQLHHFTIPNIPGCLSFAIGLGGSHTWPYVPLVVHQTLIFSLTILKGVEHYRKGVYGTSLINTFYRDGIVYYALLVAFSIGNLATTHTQSDMITLYFLIFLQQVIHSILSSRMMLHLRQESAFALRVGSEQSTSLDFVTIGAPAASETSVMTTQSRPPERLEISNHGWFGQEESPVYHP
ncbi:hypothetical protein BDZ94DRAFT_388538 [Collybia nuda]|uniref:DUF6533 domain-containing protein n=1 Tax=Collybia nuda TaxID=64659 RepID=A0A9P5YAU7_9AGAR|nr:hypothetical protein BDZ94DRAFT_388538 [Collybia nuda]